MPCTDWGRGCEQPHVSQHNLDAELLLYVLSETGIICPAGDDKPGVKLCAVLKELGPLDREATLNQSIKLREWWNTHLANDAKREKKERDAVELNKLRESALAKLTPEERKALVGNK